MDTKDHRNGACHVLVWYSREDETVVGEVPMEGISTEQLQAVLRPPAGDPLMFDSYPVRQAEAKFLGEALGIDLDVDHFDYFVECDAREKPR
jgi:hypothetical protein